MNCPVVMRQVSRGGREDFGISSGTNAARTDLIESTPKNAAIVEVVGG